MVDYPQEAYKEAALSKSNKRKVGAIVVSPLGMIHRGHNATKDGSPCEINGKTSPKVVHAEINAISAAINYRSTQPYNRSTLNRGKLIDYKIYITHEPCADCLNTIQKAGIRSADIIVVTQEFMKFDTSKLRFDLIPVEILEELAKILTYGAKKYKPNNWKNCKDMNRYIAAIYRHLVAYQKGELYDSESKFLHLSHALTNISFIIYQELANEQNNNTTK